jgi:hypothetical protein
MLTDRSKNHCVERKARMTAGERQPHVLQHFGSGFTICADEGFDVPVEVDWVAAVGSIGHLRLTNLEK